MKRTKRWTIERIMPKQYRVSVQGFDQQGREQCVQFLRSDYQTAVRDASAHADQLGILPRHRRSRA